MQVQDEPASPRSKWQPFFGWGLFALGVTERIIGWGGSIDFLIARSDDPGWVGVVLTRIGENSGLIGVVMMLGGFWLIMRDHQAKVEQRLREVEANQVPGLSAEQATELIGVVRALKNSYDTNAPLLDASIASLPDAAARAIETGNLAPQFEQIVAPALEQFQARMSQMSIDFVTTNSSIISELRVKLNEVSMHAMQASSHIHDMKHDWKMLLKLMQELADKVDALQAPSDDG